MPQAKRGSIPAKLESQVLQSHLEAYKRKALELGASAAEVIPAGLVEVDERVRLKCLVPRCMNAGETPHCPPHTPEPEFMRKALSRYLWAILYRVDLEHWEQYIPAQWGSPAREPGKTWSYHDKASEITGTIEGMAFRDGYYLALGLGGGSCKTTLCHGFVCRVLDSGPCRFFLRARPSMEAVGIDAIALALKVGWEVYPVCYVESDPDVIPHAVSMGIVFIC
ncbi:MAG: DUF2284 domain-containing protein [Chloroflexi bacterium]|nr:DUF2284 domain-containing protein [Chloroflexota bacterium]